MGAKKNKNKNGGENKNNNQQQQQQQQQKKNNGGGGGGEGGGKKDGDGSIPVVLKLDLHCEGCATKIINRVRGFQGVESVRGDLNSNKLTVTGKVDPAEVREMVEQKVKKKVELVSPTPKKDKDGGGGGGGEKKGAEKKEAEPKKSKEPPVITAVMKLNLHCQGCIQKIRQTVRKTKGYQEMSIDDQKNLIMVKGTMDMKALAEALNERLRRPVEIVPPKNDAGDQKKDKEKGGDQKKEKEKGGGEKVKGGDEAAAGDGGGGGGGGLGEENRMMQYVPNPYMNGYGYGYPVQVEHYPTPQMFSDENPNMFSDENPNACSIM